MKYEKDYLSSRGNCCPYCKADSIDIEGGSIDIQEDKAIQPMSCLGCGGSWISVYTLSNIEEA